jgi:hypothetical protein
MDIKDFESELMKTLNSVISELNSKPVLQEIGDQVVEIIKKRTRTGYGVDKSGGSKQKLKPLATSTKKTRKKKKLDSTTTASKSNVTQTGDMLRDLGAYVEDEKVTIGFKDSILLKRAEYVSEDRPFNTLSAIEIEQVKKKIELKLNNLIKKANSK